MYLGLYYFFPKNSYFFNFSKITMYLIVRFFLCLCIFHILSCFVFFPQQGFRPEGEIPRRHSSKSRVYQGKYLQLKYQISMPEKNLDFLEQGPRGIGR